VLGLFEKWDCSVEERQLISGDILLLHTHGATESFNDAGEEFGERRLVEAFRRHRGLSLPAVIASIVREVRQFNPNEQQDEITLIVAKCRENVAPGLIRFPRGSFQRRQESSMRVFQLRQRAAAPAIPASDPNFANTMGISAKR